jgi:hypothetical protein
MTPKQRMLAAYRGQAVDTTPVAPEFWYYYPAKVLGVDMIQFQREVPFWKALQTTFRKHATEGWGATFPSNKSPHRSSSSSFTAIGDGRFRDRSTVRYKDATFTASTVYDPEEPSWSEEQLVKSADELPGYLDMQLDPDATHDFSGCLTAHAAVGEDYLLEMWMGVPFFDFFSGAMGFEDASLFFLSDNDEWLERARKRYTEYQLELARKACAQTPFESFVLGCSASCTSLLGTSLWRRWDKPFIAALAQELHLHGRLLHVHFHGRSLEAAADFPEMGVDSVCPFERPPGGDVGGLEGLVELRRRLGERVAMNGNVHTVETLIRGTPEDVRREVREIKSAFRGSRRLIIGTGDQVGKETPEENIAAMIEEGRAPHPFQGAGSPT